MVVPYPPLKSWMALKFCLKQVSQCIFSSTNGLPLRGQITYAPLGQDTYNIVDAILSTVWIRKIKNTGTNSSGEYIYSWAHHRQRSGDCKSHSDVGSTISPRDITCGFHTASMSPCALRRFFQVIGSCFKQDKSKIGGATTLLSDMNLHESSHGIPACLALCTWNSKFWPGKQKKHHVNTLGPVTRKLYEETTKTKPGEKKVCKHGTWHWHDILTF